MSKMRRVDKIIAILTDRGFSEVVPSKSRKFRQFTSHDEGVYYWIGKNGAVRKGKGSSDSVSITKNF